MELDVILYIIKILYKNNKISNGKIFIQIIDN
jgi:hypothetical protein